MAKKKKPSIHYVNNAEFSNSVVEYVKTVRAAREANLPDPVVPEYIAQAFLKICEGLSRKDNFIAYTYREEMVMDAVENCLRAVLNYNIEAATRTGKPNAFAYFTQISWYAFLRRIAKEQKERDIKLEYIAESGVETYLDGEDVSNTSVANFIDQLKERIDRVREGDMGLKRFKQKNKKKTKRKKRTVKVDSDLTEFMG